MAGKVIDATLRFVDQFTQPMGRAMSSFQNHSKEITRAGKQIEKAGKSISKMGSTLTKAITVPIVGLGVMAVKTAADFQEGMSKVQSISSATAEEMELLSEKAKEMGAKTKFSARESADAFSYMAMAGWRTEQMLKSIEPVMYLAGATGTDLAQTSDIVTDAMTALGMAADQDWAEGVSNATHFTNVLASAANASNTNVLMLGESFQYVAPVAGALGYSVDDVALALGLMANSGIKASMSGTALRSAFTNMVNPTDKMAAAMNRLGISATNEDGSMKTLRETMDMLREKMFVMSEEQKEQTALMLTGKDTTALAKEAMKGLTQEEIDYETALGIGLDAIKHYDEAQLNSALAKEYTKKELAKMTEEQKRNLVAVEQGTIAMEGLTQAEQAAASATIFGKTAMAGMLAIVNASEDDYNKLALAIEDCDLGDGAAKTMYAIANDNLNGRLTVLKSTMESIAITFGEKLMPHVEKGVAWLQSLADKVNSLDDKTVGMILNIAGKAALIGPAFSIFGKATTTVGKTVTMFGKLGTAINKGVKAFDKVKNIGKLGTIFGKFGSAGKAAFMAITGPAGATIGILAGVVAAGVLVYKNWDKIKEGAKELGNNLKRFFGGITDYISGIFTKNWEKAWTGAKDILGGIFGSFVVIVKAPINGIISLVNAAIGGLNKINIKIPSWIPGLGGKEFGVNIPKLPMLAKGTKNWQGGLAITQEKGGEIMDLPRGTRVYPHDESIRVARRAGEASAIPAATLALAFAKKALASSNNDLKEKGKETPTVVIEKLADTIHVRKEEDIHRIVKEVTKNFVRIVNNLGGSEFA